MSEITNVIAALREESSADAPEELVAATRRRVLLAAGERRRRRVLLLRYVAPIAAVLALGTAWAALGERLAGEALVPDASIAIAVIATPGPAPAPAQVIEVLEPPDAAVAPPPPPPPHRPPPASRTSTRPVGDPEEDLYRTGHRAHFVEHDEAASLTAWNAYLAEYPDGRFAPEARYNRALALVSLGRTEDARAALAPFASGDRGGYRQTEAQALLRALATGPKR